MFSAYGHVSADNIKNPNEAPTITMFFKKCVISFCFSSSFAAQKSCIVKDETNKNAARTSEDKAT